MEIFLVHDIFFPPLCLYKLAYDCRPIGKILFLKYTSCSHSVLQHSTIVVTNTFTLTSLDSICLNLRALAGPLSNFSWFLIY